MWTHPETTSATLGGYAPRSTARGATERLREPREQPVYFAGPSD